MPECTRSLACRMKEHTSKSTTGSPVHAGFPRAIGFNGLLRALPGVHDFLVTVIGAMQSIVANLTPAKGRLVPAFRSSWAIAEPPFTNFGKQRALANSRFQCRFRFEVPGMDSQQSLQELQIGGTGTTRLRRPL